MIQRPLVGEDDPASQPDVLRKRQTMKIGWDSTGGANKHGRTKRKEGWTEHNVDFVSDLVQPFWWRCARPNASPHAKADDTGPRNVKLLAYGPVGYVLPSST